MFRPPPTSPLFPYPPLSRSRRPPMPAESGPRPSRRYPTFVGIAFLVLIAVATVNTIRTKGGATLERGTPLPEFAVPDARTGPLDRKSTRLNSSHLVISYAVF